jgi:hypothetical protein
MTLVISDDPNYRSRVLNGLAKSNQDMSDYVTLSLEIGRRAAYRAVFGVDDPSLDEDSDESKEEINLDRRVDPHLPLEKINIGSLKS